MSNSDTLLLDRLKRECFYRFQPQPLIDLLNKRGIIGSTAEVFWTYFHWGFCSGTFTCQLSSTTVAEALFIDVRTVQRANKILQDAGLISRARTTHGRGTHLEAPAITEITIPDDEARALFESAPSRLKGDEPHIASPSSNHHSKADNPKSDYTAVYSSNSPRNTKAPFPTPRERPTKKLITHTESELAYLRTNLPYEARRVYDMCQVKATPDVFQNVLDKLGYINQKDSDILMAPLIKTLAHKNREVAAVQVGSSEPRKPSTKASLTVPKKRPTDPRLIPHHLVQFIESRLQDNSDSNQDKDRDLIGIAKEIIYSITIGTMRGIDLMHAVNATIKLVTTKKWSRPKGMPHGWQHDHVLSGTA